VPFWAFLHRKFALSKSELKPAFHARNAPGAIRYHRHEFQLFHKPFEASFIDAVG